MRERYYNFVYATSINAIVVDGRKTCAAVLMKAWKIPEQIRGYWSLQQGVAEGVHLQEEVPQW